MSETARCPQCGGELLAGSQGLCPACLLKLGLTGAIPAVPPITPEPPVAKAAAPPRRRGRLAAVTGAALLLGIGAGMLLRPHARPVEPSPVKLSILPPRESAVRAVAVSPDGRTLALTAADRDGQPRIWIRPLAALDARPLAGTEGASDPFWSPDSTAIGFFAEGKLKRIAVAGGDIQTLADAPDGRGGAWGPPGTIVFAPSERGPLLSVPAEGGPVRPATRLDSSRLEVSHRWPSFLPDGRHFFYTAVSAQRGKGGIEGGRVEAPLERRHFLADLSNAAYAGGFLLFARNGALEAQPFDPARNRLLGEPRPVAEPIGYDRHQFHASYSVSTGGVLVYAPAGQASENALTWFDRHGKVLGRIGAPAAYAQPELSPDGRRVALTREDPQTGAVDVWVDDLTRNVSSRFSFDQDSGSPVWSPDGTRIAFQSNPNGTPGLAVQRSDGGVSPDLLLSSGQRLKPTGWSNDGRFLLYQSFDPSRSWDLWMLPFGGDRKPVPFRQTPFAEQDAVFSPDGRWIAYDSNESGRPEVYVQGVSTANARTAGMWQVSDFGGSHPHWGRDGSELYYLAAEHALMAVPVHTGTALELGRPQPLFAVRGDPSAGFAVSPDGNRFLIPDPVNEDAAAPLTVVLHWTAGSPQR